MTVYCLKIFHQMFVHIQSHPEFIQLIRAQIQCRYDIFLVLWPPAVRNRSVKFQEPMINSQFSSFHVWYTSCLAICRFFFFSFCRNVVFTYVFGHSFGAKNRTFSLTVPFVIAIRPTIRIALFLFQQFRTLKVAGETFAQ